MNHLTPYNLFEGITDTVFHFTTPSGLLGIAEQDRFRLTFATGDDLKGTPKPFYLSVSRTGSSKFGYAKVIYKVKFPVCLELDGRKLGQHHKGKPVDFWGPARKHDSFEYEDRIMSDNPYITNASSYITGIHVLGEKTERYRHDTKDMVWNINLYVDQYRAIIAYAAKHQINISFYHTRDDWNYKRNGVAELNTQDMWEGRPISDEKWESQNRDMSVLCNILPILVIYEPEKQAHILSLLEFEPSYEMVEKMKYRMYSYQRYCHEPNLLANEIESMEVALVNIRKDSRCTKLLAYVAQEYRKYGVRTAKEYTHAKLAKMAPPE